MGTDWSYLRHSHATPSSATPPTAASHTGNQFPRFSAGRQVSSHSRKTATPLHPTPAAATTSQTLLACTTSPTRMIPPSRPRAVHSTQVRGLLAEVRRTRVPRKRKRSAGSQAAPKNPYHRAEQSKPGPVRSPGRGARGPGPPLLDLAHEGPGGSFLGRRVGRAARVVKLSRGPRSPGPRSSPATLLA